MPRQLKGTLQDLRTTQLLHLINLAKKTGTLHVYEGVPTGRDIIMGDGETKRPEMQAGKERAKVAFREGKLIYAQSTSQDGHLATVLHKSGKLNDEQHRVIREKAADIGDKALAVRLIGARYVTQADIAKSVQQHTLDIVFDLMTWTKEPFVFEEGELPGTDTITVPLDLENVIMEGTRRAKEIDQLEEVLPNLDFALKFPDGPSQDKFKGVQLSVEEWRVISFINPKNSIRQIAKACNMTDMQIRKVVYGLMNAGLVDLVKPLDTNPRPTKAGAKSGISKLGNTPEQRSTVKKLIERIQKM